MLAPGKYLLLCGCLLFSLPLLGNAASYVDTGDYRVHYSAFNSKVLTPEIARTYDIRRSGHNSVLNITVQKKQGDGSYAPQRAEIAATFSTIKSQYKTIDMNEVTEGKVVYYLGQFKFVDGETLKFDIKVTPPGGQSISVNFDQQFFVER